MKDFLIRINFYNILIGFLILSVFNNLIFGSEVLSSVLYRVISTLLSMLVLLISFINNDLRHLRNSKLFMLYMIFSMLYLLRIFVDIFIFDRFLDGFQNDLGIFYLSAVSYVLLLPLSVASITSVDLGDITKKSFFVYGIPFLLHAGYTMSSFGVVQERESNFESVGVNIISIFAAILAAWSFIKLLTPRFGLAYKAFCGIILLITIYTLAVAATRSAFVALGIIITLYLAVNFKALAGLKYSLNIFIAVLIIVISSPYWISWFDLLTVRFSYAVDTGTTGREHIYSKAIEAYMDFPVFGYSFILPQEAYFHNFLLDAFVSTGFIGGVLFIYLNIKAFKICLKWLDAESNLNLFAIGYIATIVFGMFTTNLYSNYIYWSYLLCVLSISEKIKSNKYENYY